MAKGRSSDRFAVQENFLQIGCEQMRHFFKILKNFKLIRKKLGNITSFFVQLRSYFLTCTETQTDIFLLAHLLNSLIAFERQQYNGTNTFIEIPNGR